MTQDTSLEEMSFHTLGIAPKLLEILDGLKFTTPTPIQHQSIPVALAGKDVVGIAQTGTGKTLAFGIPTIQNIAQNRGRALVILPTRELALQVEETFHKVGRPIGLKTAILIGGAAMGPQLQAIRANPHVIIATPGRLVDHLEQKTINLSDVTVLILDEADRMLDMGFAPQINKILRAVPTERQTMLFSATLPHAIMKIATGFMKLPVRIEVATQGTTAERVEQEVFVIPGDKKMRLLDKILAETTGTTIVFARTKWAVKKMCRQIQAMGHTAAELHSNRSLAQRKQALEGFKAGKYRVLVCTDIAARGIDVNDISLVINYDLPDQSEDYVHRIGRTARAGKSGKAISFVAPDEQKELYQIERLIRKHLVVSQLPELPVARPQVQVERGPRGGGGFSSGRSHGQGRGRGGRSFKR
jgi:ATP-dependent RNA helicase RhlE